jgi:rare lipoprotein A
MQKTARTWRMALVAAAAASLGACASVEAPSVAGAGGPLATPRAGPPYQVNGIWYVPREQPNYNEVGTASWYGDAFHGRSTADGEIFDMNAASAAHTTLPLPCLVEVTNLDNGRKLVVRVNDRGPFVGDRIIDLSREAARELGYERQGLARVRVRYVGPAPLLGPEAGVRVAQARRRPAPAATPAQAYPYQLASAQPARPRPATAPAPRAPSPASDDEVAFISGVSPAGTRQLQILPSMPSSAVPATPVRVYRVQAGAFSEEVRARRVAAQLSNLGSAAVEMTQREGTTLYRVVLPGTTDVIEAYDLRARVAEEGFRDAVVIGPS